MVLSFGVNLYAIDVTNTDSRVVMWTTKDHTLHSRNR